MGKNANGNEVIKYIAVYFFTWLSGLIALIIAGKDKKLKFNGAQALVLGIIIVVVGLVIPLVGGIIAFILWLYGIYAGYSAGKGKDIVMPVISYIVKPYK